MTDSQNLAELDSFALNKEIAYKGELGRLREDYCRSYIERKQKIFGQLEKRQQRLVLSRSEKITCGRGCASCCYMLVGATIQEGEAICYYLYQNETLLARFLETYPAWRARVKETGDLFQPKDGEIGDPDKYVLQNIPCPFLTDNSCLIYPVRPIVCAGLIATTPAEWCHPLHPKHSEQKSHQILDAPLLADQSFYGTELARPAWSFMPIMVHNILEWGLPGMPAVAEKDWLVNRFMRDLEVRRMIEGYISRAKGES